MCDKSGSFWNRHDIAHVRLVEKWEKKHRELLVHRICIFTRRTHEGFEINMSNGNLNTSWNQTSVNLMNALIMFMLQCIVVDLFHGIDGKLSFAWLAHLVIWLLVMSVLSFNSTRNTFSLCDLRSVFFLYFTSRTRHKIILLVTLSFIGKEPYRIFI